MPISKSAKNAASQIVIHNATTTVGTGNSAPAAAVVARTGPFGGLSRLQWCSVTRQRIKWNSYAFCNKNHKSNSKNLLSILPLSPNLLGMSFVKSFLNNSLNKW